MIKTFGWTTIVVASFMIAFEFPVQQHCPFTIVSRSVSFEFRPARGTIDVNVTDPDTIEFRPDLALVLA
jgi:hypothetical protein